ncbi:DUF427 domain-containing protein [Tomitella biformata]|uniref:DUF427 domain-containing protein n=1 Tax=Tomitella biformata TaxID=630403 RepID=UPI00057086A0|nr:DUF427 domain-containing protein [Tomitella biformata]
MATRASNEVDIMRVEPSDRWVRGFVGETAVVDSHTPLLFWEESFPVPSYAFARVDVRTDLLGPGSPPAERHPFFGPRGPVGQWFDLHLDGHTRQRAAWVRADPALAGRIVFSWQPGVLDRWLEEDEKVSGHPRDPHKRVDALPSSRHVRIARGGDVLAESSRPVLLFETGLPTRYYLPREDVDLGKLTARRRRTHCPYKGDAEEYWDTPGAESVAWSYPRPFPAVGAIAGRIAFYNGLVDITVDGKPLEASP